MTTRGLLAFLSNHHPLPSFLWLLVFVVLSFVFFCWFAHYKRVMGVGLTVNWALDYSASSTFLLCQCSRVSVSANLLREMLEGGVERSTLFGCFFRLQR
jgi:hypothetical protein